MIRYRRLIWRKGLYSRTIPTHLFAISSVYLDRSSRTLCWGVQGLAEEVPAGFSFSTLATVSKDSVVENILSEWWQRRDEAISGAMKVFARTVGTEILLKLLPR